MSMEAELSTQLGDVKFGGSSTKSTPTSICKGEGGGGRFGEWDVTYPLSSIQKP